MSALKPGQHCLYIKETGGCDYTIGCGALLEPLPDSWTAKDVCEIFGNLGLGGRDAMEVLLVKVDRDLMDLYDQYCAELIGRRAETVREAKLAELERLKRELGVP